MYDSGFARRYDLLMADVDYDGRAEKILDCIKKIKPDAKDGLDLATGSGNFALRFCDGGMRMLASDISPDMLDTAKQKSIGKNILYLCQGINQTNLPHPVDFLTILCDGVNYCTEGVDFETLARALKPGGVLVFDISSRYYLEKTLGDNLFFEDGEEFTYFWQNSFDKRKGLLTLSLTFFERKADGLYRREDEEQVMRAFSPEELAAAAAPYFDCEIYGYDLVTRPSKQEPRIYFVCVKRG